MGLFGTWQNDSNAWLAGPKGSRTRYFGAKKSISHFVSYSMFGSFLSVGVELFLCGCEAKGSLQCSPTALQETRPTDSGLPSCSIPATGKTCRLLIISMSICEALCKPQALSSLLPLFFLFFFFFVSRRTAPGCLKKCCPTLLRRSSLLAFVLRWPMGSSQAANIFPLCPLVSCDLAVANQRSSKVPILKKCLVHKCVEPSYL